MYSTIIFLKRAFHALTTTIPIAPAPLGVKQTSNYCSVTFQRVETAWDSHIKHLFFPILDSRCFPGP